ncbi:MAG: Spx/MgsR family RNA polymerase-binding regulatory protein [Myxococcales bacterium]|nr:Spx/MgsR family RNA polymerase-binding regulatory protein [Myxococcales bacterium]MCB9718725.1 Spx/MgsR family RNA polymerase-binding regulatory protein [Myxococcales bacterium]
MAVPTVYHYPGCSTCKKALKWLREHGVEHRAVDIATAPPSAATLRKAVAMEGGPPRQALFNTAGRSYREGGFKDRLPGMSDAEAFAALAADGMLIKRPLVIGDGFVLVGFREAEWAKRLG